MTIFPALLERTVERIRESFGHPVRLRRLLQERPEIRIPLPAQPQSIWMEDVFPWHQREQACRQAGTSPGVLFGWQLHGDHYSSFSTFVPALASMTSSRQTHAFMCDIREVGGLAEAESDLSQYTDFRTWVEQEAPQLIQDISPAQLATTLAHRHVRVSEAGSADRFRRFAWDRRLFLDNSADALYFGAARVIAAALGQAVPLRAELTTHYLNPEAADQLRKEFEMFLIPDQPGISTEFHEALQSIGVTWLSQPVYLPYLDCRAIFLPRSEGRSMQIADVLRGGGITDLGRLLQLHVSWQKNLVRE